MASIHLLQYDIPETRVHRDNGTTYSRPVMANPSSRLWRAGAVRLTLSCWLIHDGRMPYSLIADFNRFGVKWESVPFDPSASESLARMALESIRKEIKEYVERARETRATEDARLAAGGDVLDAPPAELARLHARYRKQLAVVARRVRECVKRVSIAAERFGISPEAIGVGDANAAISGIKEGMTARADAFARAHGVICRAVGKKDAMAKAVAADDVFGPIAADFLDELDTPDARAAAAQLRSAFGYDF